MVFGDVRGPGFLGSRPSYVVALGESSGLSTSPCRAPWSRPWQARG
jgi:hypothetical protein